MRWKLAALALIALLLAIAPVLPIGQQTVSIKIDLPPGAAAPTQAISDQTVDRALNLSGAISEGVWVLAVLGGAAAIARRIVRKRRS